MTRQITLGPQVCLAEAASLAGAAEHTGALPQFSGRAVFSSPGGLAALTRHPPPAPRHRNLSPLGSHLEEGSLPRHGRLTPGSAPQLPRSPPGSHLQSMGVAAGREVPSPPLRWCSGTGGRQVTMWGSPAHGEQEPGGPLVKGGVSNYGGLGRAKLPRGW